MIHILMKHSTFKIICIVLLEYQFCMADMLHFKNGISINKYYHFKLQQPPSEIWIILHCTRIPQNMTRCQISFIPFFFLNEKYNSLFFLMKKNRLSQLLEFKASNFFYGYSWFPEHQPWLVFVVEKKKDRKQ